MDFKAGVDVQFLRVVGLTAALTSCGTNVPSEAQGRGQTRTVEGLQYDAFRVNGASEPVYRAGIRVTNRRDTVVTLSVSAGCPIRARMFPAGVTTGVALWDSNDLRRDPNNPALVLECVAAAELRNVPPGESTLFMSDFDARELRLAGLAAGSYSVLLDLVSTPRVELVSDPFVLRE